MTTKIADTFNEYGTPVTMFRCESCNETFTVCPAVEDKHMDQWSGCLGEGCESYDPERDADKLRIAVEALEWLTAPGLTPSMAESETNCGDTIVMIQRHARQALAALKTEGAK